MNTDGVKTFYANCAKEHEFFMSIVIHEVKGYRGSRDYRRLVELMKVISVICIVDYRSPSGLCLRDLAQTLYDGYSPMLSISSRGYGYINAVSEEEFIVRCADLNVEFIDIIEKCDPIVESVRNKLLHRSLVGLKKYGVGLDRKDLKPLDWLRHLQEELLDAAGYSEVEIRRLEKGETALTTDGRG